MGKSNEYNYLLGQSKQNPEVIIVSYVSFITLVRINGSSYVDIFDCENEKLADSEMLQKFYKRLADWNRNTIAHNNTTNILQKYLKTVVLILKRL